MTWETCGMSIPRPITSVATKRRNSPFRNRSKVFNLDSWRMQEACHPLFLLRENPTKNGSTHKKKVSEMWGFHGGGFMEISWWFWSKKSVIRKEWFYDQISWPWGRRNRKTSHRLRSIFSCSWSPPETFGKGRSSPKASWNFQSNGFFEDGVCLKKL